LVYIETDVDAHKTLSTAAASIPIRPVELTASWKAALEGEVEGAVPVDDDDDDDEVEDVFDVVMFNSVLLKTRWVQVTFDGMEKELDRVRSTHW